MAQIGEITAFEQTLATLDYTMLRKAKRLGFSDRQLARIVNEKVESGEWRVGDWETGRPRDKETGKGGDQAAPQSPISNLHSPNPPISELDIRRLRAELGLTATCLLYTSRCV